MKIAVPLLIFGTILEATLAFTQVSNPKYQNGIKPSSPSSTALHYVDKNSSPDDGVEKKENLSFRDRIAKSGVASAAAMAAAVNRAVAMKPLEAPAYDKSYIALDKSENELDEEGLPVVYDKDLIEQYWSKERGALNQRWGYFVKKAVPFLTKMMTLMIRDGKIADDEIPGLSRQVRLDLQDLGPTFIKAGQMMSVRPDVLPQVRAFKA